MRHLMIALAVAVSTSSFAAEPLVFTEDVEVPGSADDIMVRAREWAARTFGDSSAVIKVDDGAAHVLVGRGVIPFPTSSMTADAYAFGTIDYAFKIEARDGGYRLQVMDFAHRSTAQAMGIAMASKSFGYLTTSDAPDCGLGPKKCGGKWWVKLFAVMKARAADTFGMLRSGLRATMGAQ